MDQNYVLKSKTFFGPYLYVSENKEVKFCFYLYARVLLSEKSKSSGGQQWASALS
jgi:hypothetical protein